MGALHFVKGVYALFNMGLVLKGTNLLLYIILTIRANCVYFDEAPH